MLLAPDTEHKAVYDQQVAPHLGDADARAGLCGGLTVSVPAGFLTLVEAGYQPESA